MLLGEKLAAISNEAAEEQAIIFASEIVEKLEEKAVQGERQLLLRIDVENEKWTQSEHFLKTVEFLLEGVQVEVVVTLDALFSIVKYKELKLSW